MNLGRSILTLALAALTLSHSVVAAAAPPLEPLLETFAGRFFLVETEEGAALATRALGRPISSQRDYLRFIRSTQASALSDQEMGRAADRISRLKNRIESGSDNPDVVQETELYGLARDAASSSGLTLVDADADAGELDFFPAAPQGSYTALRTAFLSGVATAPGPNSALGRILAKSEDQLNLAERLTRGTALLARDDGELAGELVRLRDGMSQAQKRAIQRALGAPTAAGRNSILSDAGFTAEQRRALLDGGVAGQTNAVRASIRMLTPEDELFADAVKKLVAQRSEMLPQFAQSFSGQIVVDLPAWSRSGQMPFRSSYERILRVFQDPTETYKLIQDLEKDVMVMAQENNLSREEALERVLVRDEEAGGFKAMIRLEPRIYSPEEFNEVLRDGTPFQDPNFMNNNHGEQTHRIQWNLVMRDMDANPQFYRGTNGRTVRPVKLYTTLGEDRMRPGDGLPAGVKSVWDVLFDSFNRNATHPEFFKPSQRFWPEAGNWQ